MRPGKPNTTDRAKRRAWEPPSVTRLPIGTETRAASKSNAPDSGKTRLTHPSPPAAPASKLGFSFEMAFPLSARILD